MGDVYRIKAMAVLADGRHTPETAIQRYDYGDVDGDDDGLIDIYTLDMFDDMRLNLAGTSYNGITTGGPTSMTANCTTDSDSDGIFLCGYELMGDLDFALASSYESGTVNTTWCPDTSNNCIGDTTEEGFLGIGPATGATGGFTGIFEGNGNSISNFYGRNTANTSGINFGLFALTNNGGTIRNITVEANLFGGILDDYVGGLVGRNDGGTIAESSVSGSTNGGSGNFDRVGGLVGLNNTGTISESSASVSVDGGPGDTDWVGGLVGFNVDTITASYATGNVNGGDGDDDEVGGLVGNNYYTGGIITASHATGDVDGGMGRDTVGGLVGKNEHTIIASYAIGDANGGVERADIVGGLVGETRTVHSIIIASYATGDATGGDEGYDLVGGLVGTHEGGTIIASYATGNANGRDGDYDYAGGLIGHVLGSSVVASYATGNADGGLGANDQAGSLMGWNTTGTTTDSYSFGTLTNGNTGVNGTALPDLLSGVTITSATQLGASQTTTTANAGASWNNAGNNTLGAWNFGTTSENPALVYNDYDGGGTTYAACTPDNGGYPTTIPGITTMLTCGTTLVGDYRPPVIP